MRSIFLTRRTFRQALLALLCAAAMAGCQPGTGLDHFSGRWLRAVMLIPSGDGSKADFRGELRPKEPEIGCSQLHPSVKATLNDIPLKVYPGPVPPLPDGPCGPANDMPLALGTLETEPFFGEPRNAVLEFRDGDEHILAEYLNYFARHTFAQFEPIATVKPGEELFLPWDPPTDDLSVIEEVTIGDRHVPAKPEGGGVRVTFPADLPAGTVRVGVRGSDIPAVRCEGAALCTGESLVILDRSVQVSVQP
jgi:hypothetical protein